jgi:hypothetical protein
MQVGDEAQYNQLALVQPVHACDMSQDGVLTAVGS